MVIRTQISLSEEQMRRLRVEARRRKLPIAALVREAVDTYIPADDDDRAAKFARAIAVAGTFRSDTGDIAVRHDEILGEGRW